MIENFDKLLNRLEALGYEVDNESLEMIEEYSGHGYLHFLASESIGFSLPFYDYELDLSRYRHEIKFTRKFEVRNATRSHKLEIYGLDDSPRAEFKVTVLPNKLEEALKTGVDTLKAIKIV